jgi:hypothetical protein
LIKYTGPWDERPPEGVTFDLGCGPNPKNPFNAAQVFGIDVRNDVQKNILKAGLTGC